MEEIVRAIQCAANAVRQYCDTEQDLLLGGTFVTEVAISEALGPSLLVS